MTDVPEKKFTVTNWIATIAIVFSFGASLWSAVLSYYTSTSVQALQARDADLRSFEESSKQLQEAGATYVSTLNKNGDLTAARDILSAILARQSIAALSLRNKIKTADEQYINDYIDALTDLNTISRKTSRPEDFRTWAESYGRTVDAGSSLTQAVTSNGGKRG